MTMSAEMEIITVNHIHVMQVKVQNHKKLNGNTNCKLVPVVCKPLSSNL